MTRLEDSASLSPWNRRARTTLRPGLESQAGSARPSLLRGIAKNPRGVLIALSLYGALALSFWLNTVLSAELNVVALAALFGLAWFVLPRHMDYRLALVYVFGFALFSGLRVFADNTPIATSFAYPPEVSRFIFGVEPVVWLQDQLFDADALGLLEYILIFVYMTYFVFHFSMAGLVWWAQRDLFRPYVAAVGLTLLLGLTIYYLVPTAPPWLASQTGEIGSVTRVIDAFAHEVSPTAKEQAVEVAGVNDVAAMPSIHMALTCVIAFTALRLNRIFGIMALLYAASMAFALMYLGEHYAIDIAAGVVLAYVAVKLCFRRYQTMHAIRSEIRSERLSQLRQSQDI